MLDLFRRILLSPLTLLYAAGVGLRNFMYQRGSFHSQSFTVPIVSVGNLRVGGTGKSPMVVYMVEMLRKEHKVAVLSRGYGRRTKGFRLAAEGEDADTLGDEPYMYYLRFGSDVPVAVAEYRAEGIPFLAAEYPELELIILDDAFQHRAVARDLNLLLSTWQAPFWSDSILPGGRLREPRAQARRADCLIYTRTPAEASEEQKKLYRENATSYLAKKKDILFSGQVYGRLTGLFSQERRNDWPKCCVVLTGIAQAEPLLEFLRTKTSVAEHLSFADHYRYSTRDVDRVLNILKLAGKDTVLISTEKDRARLLPWKEQLSVRTCYFLPIEVNFSQEEAGLLQQKLAGLLEN